jgi:hypothetical protein
MSDYKKGFEDGYLFAKEQTVERLLELDGLDDWTIDKICEMIEGGTL